MPPLNERGTCCPPPPAPHTLTRRFDERFVGFGRDKVSYVMHLARMGLKFVVHPRGFLVHAPHPTASAFFSMTTLGLWDELDRVYQDMKHSLARGAYLPHARYACGDHLLGPLMASVDSFGMRPAGGN